MTDKIDGSRYEESCGNKLTPEGVRLLAVPTNERRKFYRELKTRFGDKDGGKLARVCGYLHELDPRAWEDLRNSLRHNSTYRSFRRTLFYELGVAINGLEEQTVL